MRCGALIVPADSQRDLLLARRRRRQSLIIHVHIRCARACAHVERDDGSIVGFSERCGPVAHMHTLGVRHNPFRQSNRDGQRERKRAVNSNGVYVIHVFPSIIIVFAYNINTGDWRGACTHACLRVHQVAGEMMMG